MGIEKLTEDEIEFNQERITELLLQTKREGVDGLVEWLSRTDYFTAPASTRPDYHGCYQGGLAKHSLNVYELFRDKADDFRLDIQDDEVVISALLHDLCKAGQYIPNMVKSGTGKKATVILSETKPYKIEDQLPVGHGEKSVMMALRYIQLTDTETMLIRWHMGEYDPAWEQYGDKVQKACPALTAFQDADREATRYID